MRPTSFFRQPWHLVMATADGGELRIQFNEKENLWAFVQAMDNRQFEVEHHTEKVTKVDVP